IPVIAVKAGARTLASYSWVVMVSDTTRISMPAKGCAASMNHCISASCAARSSADISPISASRNSRASSIPAKAGPVRSDKARPSAVVDLRLRFMAFLPVRTVSFEDLEGSRPVSSVPERMSALHPAKDRRGVDQANDKRIRLIGADKGEPSQIDKGRTQKRDKKTIPTRRFNPQDAHSRRLGE